MSPRLVLKVVSTCLIVPVSVMIKNKKKRRVTGVRGSFRTLTFRLRVSGFPSHHFCPGMIKVKSNCGETGWEADEAVNMLTADAGAHRRPSARSIIGENRSRRDAKQPANAKRTNNKRV